MTHKAGQQSRIDWATILTTAIFLLLCGIALTPTAADPDLWGHVQFGRDTLQVGLSHTTTYSFTTVNHRWINHENLSEVLMAIGMDRFGPGWMQAVKCFFGILVLGSMMIFAHKRSVTPLSCCVVVLLILMNLIYHWSLRPQLLTYVFFSVMVVLLSWVFHEWEGRWWLVSRKSNSSTKLTEHFFGLKRRYALVIFLPLLFVAWTNAHGGFVAGFLVLGLALFCRCVEALVHDGRAALPVVAYLSVVTFLTGLATFLNPYGWHLHAWLIHSLQVPRPEIVEWHGLDFASLQAWYFALLLITAVASWLRDRERRDFTQLVILAVTAWQAISHQRHISFFAILVGYWLAPQIGSLLRTEREHISEQSRALRATTQPKLVCALIVLLLATSAGLFYRTREIYVSRSMFPISAVQFMADRRLLAGNMFVTYNWSQYVIGNLGARSTTDKGIRVAFDGRFRTCYPQEVVDMHFDFVLGDLPGKRFRGTDSPPMAPARILTFFDPELVLLDREQPHSEKVMVENRDRWVLLYQDAIAQLWGRADLYDNPTRPEYIDVEQRQIGTDFRLDSVPWPARPIRS